MRGVLYVLGLLTLFACAKADSTKIIVGAQRTFAYLPEIHNKTVSLVVNQTSTIGKTHLVDSLLTLGIKINTIFAPEHGFRGEADAGEHVKSGIDTKTNLPITSLYGNNKKPTTSQLANTDVVIFDIQDVGCRFYTYLSTLHYIMESCAENKVDLIILDRPNPNGFYIAGPVLKEEYKSFVGMHPIPIVHGCTLGEMAKMINGEGWLKSNVKCNLKIIKCENYTHTTFYNLPIPPSPNLPNQQSIILYPSLCLFEPTKVSIGRGTYYPFQVIGYPENKSNFSFTPVSINGMSKYPKFQNKTCYGEDLRNIEPFTFTLDYIVKYYSSFPNKTQFISSHSFFDKLTGTNEVRKMLFNGYSAKKIELTWKEDLDTYKTIRKKYLLYPDF